VGVTVYTCPECQQNSPKRKRWQDHVEKLDKELQRMYGMIDRNAAEFANQLANRDVTVRGLERRISVLESRITLFDSMLADKLRTEQIDAVSAYPESMRKNARYGKRNSS